MAICDHSDQSAMWAFRVTNMEKSCLLCHIWAKHICWLFNLTLFLFWDYNLTKAFSNKAWKSGKDVIDWLPKFNSLDPLKLFYLLVFSLGDLEALGCVAVASLFHSFIFILIDLNWQQNYLTCLGCYCQMSTIFGEKCFNWEINFDYL